MKKLSVTSLVLVLLALVAGCGSSNSDSTGATGATASSCEPGELATKTEGKLTVATDKPAYPPYFEDDDPTNGEGLRERRRLRDRRASSAIAKAEVKWTVEPFNSSYAPGPKDFDFDVNEISITPAREKAVDFSAPYYTANQAVVALKDSDAAERDIAGRPEGRQDRRPDRHHQPRRGRRRDRTRASKPQVFNSSNDVVTALKNEQIDAVVVDLPTALYLTAVQVPDRDRGRPVQRPRRRPMGRPAGQRTRR